MLRTRVGDFDLAVYYDCQEVDPPEELFYECRELPELNHQVSDTGDINPTVRTRPCLHMWRTMKTMRIPLIQSNRYANWVRCPICGHTHATITDSATCCLKCKERHNKTNETVHEYRHQRHVQMLPQPKQPPIDAVDVTTE